MSEQYHPSMFESGVKSPRDLAEQRLAIFTEQTILDIKNRGEYSLSNNDSQLSNDNTKSGLPRHQATPLTSSYFSRTNIDNIQKLTRMKVYEKTKLVIDNQGKKEMLQSMNYIYLQYANHPVEFDDTKPKSKQIELMNVYKAEVARLNDLTVTYIVPKIVNELQAHLNYLKDASSPIQVFDYPINDSIKGQREYKSFI